MNVYYNIGSSHETVEDICSRILGVSIIPCTIEKVRFEHRFSEYLSAIRITLYDEKLMDPKNFEFHILGKENYNPFLIDLGVKNLYEITKKRIFALVDSMGKILGISTSLEENPLNVGRLQYEEKE